MAENILIGKVIAVSKEETVASTDPKKQPFTKRKLYMDCTRYDQWTRQPIGPESTPLLEFGGKGLEQLNALVSAGLKKDDVVQVKFSIVGRKVTKDGKLNIFNDIRPYAIELYHPEYYSNHQPTGTQPVQAAAPTQQAQAQVPAPAAEQNDAPKDDPFAGGEDNGGLPF